ncbi:hypothetical protein RUND412_002321 [Rhizina undulata]
MANQGDLALVSFPLTQTFHVNGNKFARQFVKVKLKKGIFFSGQFEKLAVARLKYNVSELKIRVDHDRALQPPSRKVYNCITDDSALTESIGDLKRWINDGFLTMLVPLCTLDALDNLKKGTEPANVNSRESIRFFDRCQSGGGRNSIRGVRLQSPAEMFATWAECEKFLVPGAQVPAKTSPSTSPTAYRAGGNGYFRNENYSSNGNANGNWNSHGYGNDNMGGGGGGRNRRASKPEASPTTPPKWIQGIVNCALWSKHCDTTSNETLLVTNNDDVAAWARIFGLRVVNSDELKSLVYTEDHAFETRKRHYVESQNARPTTPNSPLSARGGRNGRGGGHFSSSGGRGGRGGGGRRHSRADIREDGGNSNMTDFSRTRGNHMAPPPEFVLRGPPTGVARGRGKLWEP